MQEDVLDLSISVRTGEETNMDFRSSGERTGRSSNGNDSCVAAQEAYGKRGQRW